MLAFAPREYGRVVADARALPFRDASFDVVLMAFVLFHLAEPEVAIAEVRRVLRPRGTAGLLTWGTQPTHPAYDVWMACVERAAPPPDPRPMVHTVVDTTDPQAMRAALTEAGFTVEVTVQPFRWRPTAEQFLAHSLGIGAAARRVALLPTRLGRRVSAKRRSGWRRCPRPTSSTRGRSCKPSPDCMPTATEPAAAGWLRAPATGAGRVGRRTAHGGFPQRA
jgi:SAM-dependent methyltransferase